MIAFAVIIGIREDRACDNKTWLMGWLIMFTHSFELLLGCIVAALLILLGETGMKIAKFIFMIWSL